MIIFIDYLFQYNFNVNILQEMNIVKKMTIE